MAARKHVSRFNEAAAFVLSLISALHSSGLKASGRWEVRHDRHFGFGKAVLRQRAERWAFTGNAV